MKQYLLAFLFIILALFIKVSILHFVGEGAPYLPFFIAVILSSLYCGLRPSLLVTLIGASFGGYFLLQEDHPATKHAAFVHSLIFIIEGFGLSLIANHAIKSRILKETNELLEKKVEEANQELSVIINRLNLALESGEIGMWENNIQFNAFYCNSVLKRIVGLSPDSPDKDVQNERNIHPDDREKVKEKVRETVTTGVPYDFESRVVWPNGEIHWVHNRGERYLDANGVPQKIIGTTILIDEKKKFQERLESELEDRTRRLLVAQNAVVQTAKMSALGEMANGVAHEINSPLAVLRLKTEQMMRKLNLAQTRARELPFDDFKKDLTKLLHNVERVSEIIKGLQSFGGGEADLVEEINADEVVRKIRMLTEAKLANSGIELIYQNDSEDRMFIGHKGHLEQVLFNLLSNAYDAVLGMREKWIKIEVHDIGDDLEISVIDSGPGIPEPIRAKIMQPFFTTKDVGRGTGLGLSISKGMIESQQGKLELDTTSPHTKFVITLPKHKREQV